MTGSRLDGKRKDSGSEMTVFPGDLIDEKDNRQSGIGKPAIETRQER